MIYYVHLWSLVSKKIKQGPRDEAYHLAVPNDFLMIHILKDCPSWCGHCRDEGRKLRFNLITGSSFVYQLTKGFVNKHCVTVETKLIYILQNLLRLIQK